jgi:hypothetical protein
VWGQEKQGVMRILYIVTRPELRQEIVSSKCCRHHSRCVYMLQVCFTADISCGLRMWRKKERNSSVLQYGKKQVITCQNSMLMVASIHATQFSQNNERVRKRS